MDNFTFVITNIVLIYIELAHARSEEMQMGEKAYIRIHNWPTIW